MSTEHNSALVRRVASAIHRPDNDDSAAATARAAIDAVRTWDAEHAEPSAEALIEEIVGRDGTLTIYDPVADKPVREAETPHFRPGCEGPTMRAALLALRDAVKGERHD